MAATFAQLLLWVGVVATDGPLAPNGSLTYALYPLFLVWLVPTAVIMIRRPAGPARSGA